VYSLKYCGTESAMNNENPTTKMFRCEFMFRNCRHEIPVDPAMIAT
jgi:hypothetical protein